MQRTPINAKKHMLWLLPVALLACLLWRRATYEPPRIPKHEPGTVYGYVRQDWDGRGLRKRVSIWDSSPMDDPGHVYRYVRPNRNGYYEFNNIPPGKYRVMVDDHDADWDRVCSPFSYSIVVTSSPVPVRQDFACYQAGFVSGKFYSEDGSLIWMTWISRYKHLFHRKPGSWDAFIEKEYEKDDPNETKSWVAYNIRYKLGKFNPARPAKIRVGLTQPVGDYFIEMGEIRGGIPVRPGETTKDVNFTFPLFKGPEDRLTIKGRVKVLPGGGEGGPITFKLRVGVSRENPPFSLQYVSFRENDYTYRVHGVPPGKYKLYASVFGTKPYGTSRTGGAGYEGEILIPENLTQPIERDIVLEPDYYERKLEKARAKKRNEK